MASQGGRCPPTDPNARPEALSNEGWLTVLDGPLHGIRHRCGLPVIGYVKTHHRRMLAHEHWVRVPELTAGERSGLFAMEDALYGCYLRVGDPGPWAGLATYNRVRAPMHRKAPLRRTSTMPATDPRGSPNRGAPEGDSSQPTESLVSGRRWSPMPDSTWAGRGASACSRYADGRPRVVPFTRPGNKTAGARGQPGKNHAERNRSPDHAGSPQVGC